MIRTKIMTTRQKKYLEKILNILDISLDDFLEIKNIKANYDETVNNIVNLETELLKTQEQNDILKKMLDGQQKTIETLIEAYNKVVAKLNEFNVNELYGDIYNDFGGVKK